MNCLRSLLIGSSLVWRTGRACDHLPGPDGESVTAYDADGEKRHQHRRHQQKSCDLTFLGRRSRTSCRHVASLPDEFDGTGNYWIFAVEQKAFALVPANHNGNFAMPPSRLGPFSVPSQTFGL
jgi:hypothetical protein